MAVVLRPGTQKRSFPSAEGSARVLATSFFALAAAIQAGAAVGNIKAAVAGKRVWITRWRCTNVTAGEYPVAELLEDESGTPVVVGMIAFNNGTTAGKSTLERVYDPPLEITAGKTIGDRLQTATGDVWSEIDGYVED